MMLDKKIKALKSFQSRNVAAMKKRNAALEKRIFTLALKKLKAHILQDKFWEPKVGDLIYIPTSLFLDHGEDDIAGGLATIKKIERNKRNKSTNLINTIFVEFKEITGSYNWHVLLEEQKEHQKQYGKKVAHPDPDDRTQFNEGWDS
jgi:hypothetical protein